MDKQQYNLWLEGIDLFEESLERPIEDTQINEENIEEDDPNYNLYFQALGWDYQSKLDSQIKNKFQIGIQAYNDGYDLFAMRDRPVTEKLGWSFAKKINESKDSLFQEDFIATTKEGKYDAFRTMFYEGIRKYDENYSKNSTINSINDKESSEYIGYLFAALRTQFGNTIIKYIKNPHRNLNDIYVKATINKIWDLLIDQQEDNYTPLKERLKSI